MSHSKLLKHDDKLIGVGTLVETRNSSVKSLEVGIAIDNNYSKGKGYGKLLLRSLEETVSSNGPAKIVATVKSTNPDRNFVAMWLFKQGYIIETLLKRTETEFIKYCNNIFQFADVTLTKQID